MSATAQNSLPQKLYAHASPRSRGGTSLFDTGLQERAITTKHGPDFTSSPEDLRDTAAELRRAGFEILGTSPTTVNIAGPPRLYQQYFQARLGAEEHDVIKPGAGRGQRTATFIDCPDTPLSGLIYADQSRVANLVEGVAIEEPVYRFHEPPPVKPLPPRPRYWHLTVPRKVAELLEAEELHHKELSGSGVRLTMVDTGWWGDHPYFADQGLRGTTVLGPEAEEPDTDENGHGTGESANVFALAPNVAFTMVKANFKNMLGAFNTAVEQDPPPHIVSNSWGSDVKDPPLSAVQRATAASISLAVAKGITVVFSAGNGHFGFPAQHPDVIAVGGVYIDEFGTTRASDYASGFASGIYANRTVPDVCGLVGMRPKAAYIMLPVPPGCEIDRELAGKKGLEFPDGDEGHEEDGWAAFSGTSAAAPQVAGICALIREAHPHLSPHGIREALMNSARDVTTGATNPDCCGESAKVGHDCATGYGLVSASAALTAATFQS